MISCLVLSLPANLPARTVLWHSLISLSCLVRDHPPPTVWPTQTPSSWTTAGKTVSLSPSGDAGFNIRYRTKLTRTSSRWRPILFAVLVWGVPTLQSRTVPNCSSAGQTDSLEEHLMTLISYFLWGIASSATFTVSRSIVLLQINGSFQYRK